MKPHVVPSALGRSVAIKLSESSQVGIARRQAGLFCESLKVGETKSGQVRIVVTEAANNIVKHAGSGQVVLRTLESGGRSGIELLALDKGPGMKDLIRCLEDGYSTAGSPGTGLGAIKRLSDVFDVFTQPGGGTALLAQIWFEPSTGKTHPLVAGCICVPYHPGEPCGDWWAIRHTDSQTKMLVVDGLGHGLYAARAAEEAVRVFEASYATAPADLIQTMHVALRPTRGASLAITQIDHHTKIVRYAGVGNISGVILSGMQTRGMVSHNGTVGHELHRVREFEYEWGSNMLLAMHSDGLGTRWGLEAYPGLITRHPSLIAGVLYRDFRRERDDATIIIAAPSGSFVTPLTSD